MFGPCGRLDCKQQTLCFVVLCKTRTQAQKGTGSRQEARDTGVLSDGQQHMRPQTVFKGIHSFPAVSYETVPQAPCFQSFN